MKTDAPYIFNETNAERIFEMLDPCEKNAIPLERYYHAMETLGISSANLIPLPLTENMVTKEIYMEEM